MKNGMMNLGCMLPKRDGTKEGGCKDERCSILAHSPSLVIQPCVELGCGPSMLHCLQG